MLTAADFTAIVSVFGPVKPETCPLADFNQDGKVDAADLANATRFEFIVLTQ